MNPPRDERWTQEDAALLEPLLTPRRIRRIEAVLDERTRSLVVVLEDIRDPHNAAAVLRSCDAFGIQDVHVVAGPMAGGSFRPNERVAKGTARWLTLHWWPDPAACVEALRRRGLRVAAADLEGGVPLDALDLTAPTALVFGNEHAGVSATMRSLADVRFYVPMHGFVQSLNVSVAAAICLHEAARRRRAARGGGPIGDLSVADRAALRARFVCQSVPEAQRVLDRLRGQDPPPARPCAAGGRAAK